MQKWINWIPLTSGMTVLVLSLALAVLVVTGKGSVGQKTNQDIRTEAAEVSGLMSLSPVDGNYVFSSGQTYSEGIIIDSAGKKVDGVDVIVKFDPKKVQVVGNTISSAQMFENVTLNKVDNIAGKILFSALTFSPKPVVGIVATFQFKPLSSGSVSFSFDFTPGSTTDSNIAENGTAKDILGKVVNGKYVFK